MFVVDLDLFITVIWSRISRDFLVRKDRERESFNPLFSVILKYKKKRRRNCLRARYYYYVRKLLLGKQLFFIDTASLNSFPVGHPTN